jgi:phosphoglycerate kinase
VVDGLRLRPAAERLAHHLKMMVPTTGDALGVGTDDAVNRLRPGELLLLENVRFHVGEEKNDPAFAARLASYGDVFVNDAFGTAHRAHASTVGVAGLLPSYVGLLMESEVEALSNLLDKPARPFAAIVGGGKVSGKVAVLEALIKKVDLLVLGGGVANTFLVASGRSVGKSLYESKMVEHARRILKLAAERGVKVLLPVDGVVAKEVTRGTEFKVVSTEKLPASWHMVDLGPDSINAVRDALGPVKTILWNGPLGVFEIPAFGTATRELAKLAAEKAEAGATVVVGGGDSIAALQQLNLAGKMTHLSTGGGASLEFLEGRELPGLAVIPTSGSPYETLPIIWHASAAEKKAKAPAKKSS